MEDISRNYQCPGYIIALDKVSCLQKRRWLVSRQSHGNEFINAVRNFGSEIGYRKSPRITINFFVQCIYYTFDGFFVYKDKVVYLCCIFISSRQLLLNFHCNFNIHTTFHLVLPLLKSPFTFHSCIRFGNNYHQLFIQLTLQLKSLGCPIFLPASIYLPKVNNSNTKARC